MKLATKIIGFVLLFVGVAIILYSLSSSYDIFTGKKDVPQIFMASDIVTQETGVKAIPANSMEDIQNQMQETIKEQIGQILPSDFIPNLLNLISWSILATILIFGGTHLSGLGIKLIKD